MSTRIDNSADIPVVEPLESRILLSGTNLLDQAFAGAVAAAGELMGAPAIEMGLGKPSKPDKTSRTSDIGDTFDTAMAVLLDSMGSGSLASTIDGLTDVDVLDILATQSGSLQVDLSPLANKKNTLVGDLAAFDAGAALLVQDSDPADAGATLSFDVVSGQTYYLRIAGLDGAGKYNLSIATTAIAPPEPEPDPQPDPDPTPPPAGDYVPGSEVSWFNETLADGPGLVILGTDAADQITVSQSSGATVIITSAGTFTLSETFASVQMYGFGGDDLLVSISGAAEVVWGGAGFDSFWADSLDIIGDADAAETAAASVHRVGEFYQPTSDPTQYVSLELAGQSLVDPVAGSSYYDYSGRPLFVDGPEYDDAVQGYLSDCYFIAAMSSLAQSDPGVIEQMIAPMGDGTYAVRFYSGGEETYLRIDAELLGSSPTYARLTPDGELWVALAEKAFAQFRRDANSYSSLEYGWMSEVYAAVTDQPVESAYPSSMSADEAGQYLLENLEAGHAVTAGTSSLATSPIVAGHAYVVSSVENTDGQWQVTVYNPWGVDGSSWDSNSGDGLLTISMDLFVQNFTLVQVSMA